MAELADAHDSGSCGATHAGSSPVIRTIPSVLTELERFCMTLGFFIAFLTCASGKMNIYALSCMYRNIVFG